MPLGELQENMHLGEGLPIASAFGVRRGQITRALPFQPIDCLRMYLRRCFGGLTGFAGLAG